MARPQDHPVYRHTQSGGAVCLILLFTTAALFFGGKASHDPVLLVMSGLFVVLVLSFHSLTVEVYSGRVLIRFGIGWIRKSVDLAHVTGCKMVRNSPLYGWGIRFIGRGWLYNISGLDAVELEFTNGRILRIGTDEPERLQAAIAAQLGR